MTSSKSSGRMVIIGFACLIAGWTAGYWSHRKSPGQESNPSSAPRDGLHQYTPSIPAAPSDTAKTAAPAGPIIPKETEVQGGTDFEAALHGALAITDDTDRAVRLRDLVRSIDPADLPAALDRAKRLSWMERWQVMQALGARWAESDPGAAANYGVKSLGLGWAWNPFLNSVLEKWTISNPTAANAWLANLPPGKRMSITTELARSLASRDPQAALQMMEKQPPGMQQEWSYQNIFEQWAQRDPAGASVAAQNLPPGTARDRAFQAVVNGWTRENPEAAINWTQSFQDAATKAKLLRSAAQTWAESDPKATLTWARTIDDARLRQQIVANTLAAVAQTDPAEAQNQLRALPAGQERDNAVTEVINTVAEQDTKTAQSFLELLPQGRVRDTATGRLVMQLARIDSKAAAELLMTLPANQMADQAGNIAGMMVRSDVQSALAWANSLPEGQARKNALNGACNGWARFDPRAAAEWMMKEQPGSDVGFIVNNWANNAPRDALNWARNLPDGDTKQSAIASVVQTLTRTNANEARNVFMRDLPGPAQAAAAPQLAEALAKRDLPGTRAWAESLPPGAARNNALGGIVREWAAQDATAAANWIEKMGAGEGRDVVVTQFSGSISRRDPEGALAWASTIAEPELRSNQLEQLSSRWMQSDLRAAREWVTKTDQLTPTAKQRILNQRPNRNSPPPGVFFYDDY